jgi:hypothetical protein
LEKKNKNFYLMHIWIKNFKIFWSKSVLL